MKKRIENVWVSGFVAGIIGYLAVAVVFAMINITTGRSPFYTAALLGSSLFYGLTDPTALVIAAGPVAAFNVAHLIAFLAFGFITSWLFVLGGRIPVLQYLLFAVLVLAAFHVYLGIAVFAWEVMGAAAWWQVGFASTVAAIAMGAYLFKTHPVLAREMRDLPWDRVPELSPRKVPTKRVSRPSNVLPKSEVEEFARTPAVVGTVDIQRLVQSHQELQGEVDRLREALKAAVDDGDQPEQIRISRDIPSGSIAKRS